MLEPSDLQEAYDLTWELGRSRALGASGAAARDHAGVCCIRRSFARERPKLRPGRRRSSVTSGGAS